MKIVIVCAICMISLSLHAADNDSLQWQKKEHSQFTLYFTAADSSIIFLMEKDLENGRRSVTGFFQTTFKKKFEVYIFPNREELNQQWRKDWSMPGFNSECWMVASGVAHRLDILSPLCWKKDACDHNAGDSIEVQKIITHELVHVFHAQHNPKPTFDGMDDLSWLVEGLATAVSGQLNERRINSVKSQLKEGKVPTALSQLWTGADKYGRAGCFVEFIEQQYGLNKLIELLSLTDLPSILKALNSNETSLINRWKNKMLE